MVKKADVSKLAGNLHKAGAVNMDMKLSELLEIDGIGDIDPISPVGATAVAWDGYVVILASKAEDIASKVKGWKG